MVTNETDGCAFWIRINLVLWSLIGIIILISSLGGCAHGRSGPADHSRGLVRMCGPQVIVLAADASDELVAATERAAEQWNEAADAKLFVILGRGWFNSGEAPPNDPLVTVQQLADGGTEYGIGAGSGDVRRPAHRGGTSIQHARNGCSFGTGITIYASPETLGAALEYKVKHELGHALGLPHAWFGVMAPQMPGKLSAYGATGGTIDQDDVTELRRMYQGGAQ